MLTGRVLLVLALSAFKASGAKGIICQDEEDRILGGEYAEENEFPEAVYICERLNHSAYQLCGGTVLSEQWGLTANHCISREPGYSFALPGSASLTGKFVPIEYIVRHMTLDILLFKVETPFQLGDTIRPVVLPMPGEEVSENAEGTAIGWGMISQEGQFGNRLKKVTVNTITRAECKARVIDYIPEYVCTTMEDNNNGVCHGDSGSGLFVDGKQVGVVSFHDNEGQCSYGEYPEVFTRISSVRTWITEQTGI